MHFIHDESARTIGISRGARGKGVYSGAAPRVPTYCAIHYGKLAKMRAAVHREKCVSTAAPRWSHSCVQTAFSRNQYFANASRKGFTADSAAFTTQCSLSRRCCKPRGKRRVHLYLGKSQSLAERYCDIYYPAKFSESVTDVFNTRQKGWCPFAVSVLYISSGNRISHKEYILLPSHVCTVADLLYYPTHLKFCRPSFI